MPIIKSKFKTNRFLSNGHIQTIYPYLFRKVEPVKHKRIRIPTPDHDFLDLDLSLNGNSHLTILSHGLEGSSNAKYIKGLTKYLQDQHVSDVVAWNFRSCSGELNQKERFYHASDVADLYPVINYMKENYPYKSMTLVGFSLGGNLTACYLGKMANQIPSEIQNAILFSTPFSLEDSIHKIKQSGLATLYSESFLKTMRQKVIEKQKLGLLQHLDSEYIKSLNCFIEFDNYVTAPLHGFRSAKDYYEQSSSLKFLDKIKTPTLIVQALDDPFMPKSCFPLKQAQNNPNLFLEIPESGGHLGFMTFENQNFSFWMEQRSAEFIKKAA